MTKLKGIKNALTDLENRVPEFEDCLKRLEGLVGDLQPRWGD